MSDLRWTSYALAARWKDKRARMGNAWSARTSRFYPTASGFVSQPEPRSFGVAARGAQLAAGNYFFAGGLVEAPDRSIWDIVPTDETFEQEIHGFAWMDDLFAAGGQANKALACKWLLEWARRYRNGSGPGWRPELAGRRSLRWINHSIALLGQMDRAEQKLFFRILGQQARFLYRRWPAAASGLPRFEAVTGLVYCALALEGKERYLPRASRALSRECDREISEDGGIANRNPEQLMEIFTLLTWAAQGVEAAGGTPGRAHLLAMERIAPTLRALRLGDGSLAQFHGGGVGIAGKLDQALSDSSIRLPARPGGGMGYARLANGRTILIMDAGKPPPVEASESAHASTLAFEMSSGFYPVITNMGSGYAFGRDWRNAARSTPSHSTLAVAGKSSARFSSNEFVGRSFGNRLTEGPTAVSAQTQIGQTGIGITASHDGYVSSHGLLHMRHIMLSPDGTRLSGIDAVEARTNAAKATFDMRAAREKRNGIPFKVHFHLHSDIGADLGLGGQAVSLTLPNGEVWVFRHEGGSLSIEPSAMMDASRLIPRATKQIVLSGRAIHYEGAVKWTLVRTEPAKTP